MMERVYDTLVIGNESYSFETIQRYSPLSFHLGITLRKHVRRMKAKFPTPKARRYMKMSGSRGDQLAMPSGKGMVDYTREVLPRVLHQLTSSANCLP
jgi:hypothetical protein